MTTRLGLARRSTVLACAIALAVVAAGAPARAAGVTATVTVRPGGLSVRTVGQTALLDTATAGRVGPPSTIRLVIEDATGSGQGWRLVMASTAFRAERSRPSTLGGAVWIVTGVGSRCALATCTDAESTVAYPVAVPAGSGEPIEIFGAGAGTGMGSLLLIARVTLAVPPDALPAQYESTVSWTVAAGP